MPYRITGIDVHKKMFAVVVADVEIDGDFYFDRRKVGTTSADLRGLADWLIEQDVENGFPMRRVVVKPPVFMCNQRDTSIEAVGVGPS